MLEPPPPPPGVEPDQDDIGIKFKSFDLNKVEHEPPRTLAGYEAEVNLWPIFNLQLGLGRWSEKRVVYYIKSAN